jgi:hypothetical protein
MGQFLETEKPYQSHFKATSHHFSDCARQPGIYKKFPRSFCLPAELSAENLLPDIRQSAIAFFHNHDIKWHDAQDGKPSNHMCDSQVCCVNFLFPFADKADALAALLRTVYPAIRGILPMDGQCLTFEWIGLDNYLNERIHSGASRTRGANFTSADAAIMFELDDGRRQIALIEWKYTESYPCLDLRFSKNGTDRRVIYRRLYDSDDSPLDRSQPFHYDDLFFEPFYQLMRQQFLACQMELHKELGADIVSLLHIAPRANLDFLAVTSPGLASLGYSPTTIWSRLVGLPGRFHTVATEDLFGQFPIHRYPDLAPWWHYITTRYGWLSLDSQSQ